ncbi:MAG: competence type IV pilus minor pilin ComGG [Anaerobacillus sp.]|uniref:competence type IV pilus minor pilin ComGG n=1 Tax=Anaerobacillus sp. TaxID=1872506 RepID=UPI00391D9E4D
MGNEKGFILPTTIIIMLLLSSFVIFQVSQYALEKKILSEEGELYTAERLLQMGVVDVLNILGSDNRENFSGNFYYEEGEVSFVVKKERNEMKSVRLISRTVAPKTKEFTFFYDVKTETVLPWLEER